MERIDEALIDGKLTRMKSEPGSVFGIIFIGLYIKHFVIDPLIRKIEFLEMDIKQLKSATV
ncbi:MAG: hypothetical protein GY781_08230 [Gammaproteobacteria bacterium]|nr:hypothetical protein [Gammaproteobacteria bacterium]